MRYSDISDEDVLRYIENTKPKTIFSVSNKCESASKKFTEKDWEALIKANEEISKRQTYGLREEYLEDRGTVAIWSNSAKEWVCSYEPEESGRTIKLDANMVFLPISPERCRRIQPCMIDLPLYYFSTEAWVRGEIDQAEAARQWAARQLERKRREKGV